MSFSSFGNSLWRGEQGQNVKGKKRSQGVDSVKEDFLQELILELSCRGSKRSHLIGKIEGHSR